MLLPAPRLALTFGILILSTCPGVQSARAPKPESKWQRLEDYPLRLLESGGGTLRDGDGTRWLVVAGGYLLLTGLRATTATYGLPLQRPGSWRRLANMPQPLTHVAQAIVRDRMYTAGGFEGTAPGRTVSDCYIFDLPSNKWSRLPNLPAPRAGGGLVYISQRNALFYSSGIFRETGSFKGIDKPDSWILFLSNIKAGWLRRASITNPRNHMSAIAVGSRYYFLGGQHQNRESSANQNTVQQYDFNRDQWIMRSPLPKPVGHIAASTVPFWNGIVVVGGINNGRVLSNRIYYYDIFADHWALVGFFSRRVQSPVCGFAFRRLYCATGAGTGSAKSIFFNRLTRPTPI